MGKFFFKLILSDGIGRLGYAMESISASVISFQISVAKKPEYNVKIVKMTIFIISEL
jgi:hypothetical protein